MKYKVGDLLHLVKNTTIWHLNREQKDYNKGQIFIVSSYEKETNVFILYSQQSCLFSEWHPDQTTGIFRRLK
jgi:hypothetical protein